MSPPPSTPWARIPTLDSMIAEPPRYHACADSDHRRFPLLESTKAQGYLHVARLSDLDASRHDDGIEIKAAVGVRALLGEPLFRMVELRDGHSAQVPDRRERPSDAVDLDVSKACTRQEVVHGYGRVAKIVSGRGLVQEEERRRENDAASLFQEPIHVRDALRRPRQVFEDLMRHQHVQRPALAFCQLVLSVRRRVEVQRDRLQRVAHDGIVLVKDHLVLAARAPSSLADKMTVPQFAAGRPGRHSHRLLGVPVVDHAPTDGCPSAHKTRAVLATGSPEVDVVDGLARTEWQPIGGRQEPC